MSHSAEAFEGPCRFCGVRDCAGDCPSEQHADLEEAERYIRDLERANAELRPAAMFHFIRTTAHVQLLCGQCRGLKVRWTLDVDLDEIVSAPCEMCKGSGEASLEHPTLEVPWP